ncbi:MAG: metal ABC transporter permease [Planctomycetales bacterium]|nr:metal ABC transporter permease [Planctomycetales bacterium]
MNYPQWLVDLQHQSPHVLKALLAGTLVSTVCGVMGCFIVLRRAAFLADALAHSMLAGVVCGYLLTTAWLQTEATAPAMLLGSMIAGLVTVVLVGFVSRFSRVKEDTVIGIMYTAVFALGGVILSLNSHRVPIDLGHFLTGQVLAVQNSDLWMMAFVAVLVLSLVVLLFRPLQLISFDPVMAASLGMPVLALEYLLTGCTSLVVVAGVNIVGVILVVGMLIIPAGTAYLLCDRLRTMLIVSALLGWTSFLLGYGWSEWMNVAPGSAVVVAGAAQFMTVFLLAPRYGVLADWRRRWNSVPQPMVEDVLGSVLRSDPEQATVKTVLRHVAGRPHLVQRAVKRLVRRELLEREGDQLRLTAAGRQEAERLVRAHRLWETYLNHVGTPAEQLHDHAHELEHVHDPLTMEYLDDKLGHPLQDPHGADIPPDVSLGPGVEARVSKLREGHHGEIVSIGNSGIDGLHVGMIVHVGPRSDNGEIWQLILSDQTTISLNHDQADEVLIRLGDPSSKETRSVSEG